MRIVSLLPSATDILFAVGAGDDVVGVTFECEVPTTARRAQVVSTSALPSGLAPAEIDAAVRAAVAEGRDLYSLDRGALTGLDPDLVVTQDLCAVCAVPVGDVRDALDYLGCTARVVTTDPSTLEGVLGSVQTIGSATGHADAAARLVRELRDRLAELTRAVEGRPRPRVAVLEWTDPPYAPGHWIPQMVTAAGATSMLGTAGTRSGRIEWAELSSADPDVVVCAPCGYDAPAAAGLGRAVLSLLPERAEVWAVDADAEFVRPGPRLVEGVATLAAIAHPDLGPPERAIRLR